MLKAWSLTVVRLNLRLRMTELLRESFQNGRKVMVFALFNRIGDLIRKASKETGDTYWGAINGSTRQEDRQAIVDEFSKHEGPACLILNPKAAGSGLNITAATVVIHFTPVWNPALEAQASARAHRRGQTEPVTVYRLFYKDIRHVGLGRAMLGFGQAKWAGPGGGLVSRPVCGGYGDALSCALATLAIGDASSPQARRAPFCHEKRRPFPGGVSR